jgi:hypothetical protein
MKLCLTIWMFLKQCCIWFMFQNTSSMREKWNHSITVIIANSKHQDNGNYRLHLASTGRREQLTTENKWCTTIPNMRAQNWSQEVKSSETWPNFFQILPTFSAHISIAFQVFITSYQNVIVIAWRSGKVVSLWPWGHGFKSRKQPLA